MDADSHMRPVCASEMLPEPDVAVFCLGNARVLGAFVAAAERGIKAIGGNISVGPNSSTAVRLMWWRDCHAGPNESRAELNVR